jgi:signal transduction histidine kinase
MMDELILNVDDTEPIRYAKTRTLQNAGYRIVEAASGEAALALVAERRPALVLLDVRLPDMSGMEVCRIIKRDFPATMVLQVSATFTGSGHRVEGLESGADSYLTQPVEPEELIAAVNALMRLKRAEDGLRQLNEELELRVAERTAQLAEANHQLHIEIEERERAEERLRHSQKMEAVGQLTGGIAHDFNNLLTGIVGSLELMQTRIAQGRIGDLGRYLDASLGSAQRAATLTHRLLAFARRQPLAPKTIDVNRLVLSIEELVFRTVGPAIRVRTALDPVIGAALCDPNQLENALLNLVINARDAMPDGGELTITTQDVRLAQADEAIGAGRYVTLAVTDTGIGMPPEVIARAFDPFFTTKPLGQGTGLGLSMLYGFVRQSGGHVRIASRPGAGTTVTMYLPRQDAAPEAAAEPTPAPPRSGHGETVLMVDDEPVVRMLAAEMLEELGYRVREAPNAAEALEILAGPDRIDLLLTDIGLPGMNGRQLADAARARAPTLPVLFVTGYADSADVNGGAQAARTDFVMKPFVIEQLGTKVARLLRAGAL